MIQQIISTISALTLISLGQIVAPNYVELASHEISLETRQPDPFVNGVFKDNILLNFAYLSGKVNSKESINWDEIRKPSLYEFKLNPGEVFAFHEDVLAEYEGKVVRTTNAHFNGIEGFKSDGYLMGDGVCHFASLIYWVSKDAGLSAYAPTSHDFAVIPGISKEYGVSIYSHPNNKLTGQRQNLYVTNNKEKAVTFKFEYDGENIKVSLVE